MPVYWRSKYLAARTLKKSRIQGAPIRLEPLETRALLASNVTLTDGVLTVEDTVGEQNTIQLSALELEGVMQIEILDDAGLRPDGNEAFFSGGDAVLYAATNVSEVHVLAGDGNDSIALKRTVEGIRFSLSGGNGDDTFNLSDDLSLDSLRGGINVVGGEGLDDLRLNDFSSDQANIFFVDPEVVSRNGSRPAVGYVDIEEIVILTGSGPDRVGVAPSREAKVIVSGDRPDEAPGDVLVLDLTDVEDPVLPGNVKFGTLTSASHMDVQFTGMEEVQAVNVPDNGGDPGNGTDPDPVPGEDRFDPNETIEIATILGSAPEVIQRDLSIRPTNDVDVFRFTASQTGWTVVNLFFDHDLGDLDLRIRDEVGNIVHRAETNNDNERLAIAVVAERFYHVEVFGFEGATNDYELDIQTFAVPSPSSVSLDANDDSGVSDSDQRTNVATPRVVIQADLAEIQAFGIPILSPPQAESRETGAAVEVFVNNESVGFATPEFGANFFEFTFEPDDLVNSGSPDGYPNDPDARGFTSSVTAATRIFDQQKVPFSRNTQMSPTLEIRFDPNAPDGSMATLEQRSTADTDQPVFGGVAEPGTFVRVLADGLRVGQQIVGSESSNGVGDDGLGRWELTTDPLAGGDHTITLEVEDLAGNITRPDLSLPITIETGSTGGVAAGSLLTPTIDLVGPDEVRADILGIVAIDSDTGLSGRDNITRGFEANLESGTADVQVAVTAEPGLVVRIRDGADVIDSFVMTNPPEDEPLARVYRRLTLTEGTHPLTVEVIDGADPDLRAQSAVLEVSVDVTAPDLDLAAIRRLHADSDTGVDGYSDTQSDRITSDNTPTFYGRAEAGNLVTMTVDGVRGGTVVAGPEDSSDASQTNWSITSTNALSDGVHRVVLAYEDVAGNRTEAERVLIFVDTQGPTVHDVVLGQIRQGGRIVEQDDAVSVFASKPANGPDPLVSSLVVQIQDGSERTAAFSYPALFEQVAVEEGHFRLVGDSTGEVAIQRVIPVFTTEANQVGLAAVELVFHDAVDDQLFNEDDIGRPLPDDRYTLTVSSSLVDPAGNRLDGESGAAAPFVVDRPEDADRIFPSGDGSAGGDFTARFTIDSRPEIGVWAAGSVNADINGNFHFDPKNEDAVNRDFVYQFGMSADSLFAGDFAPSTDAVSDSFDKLAAYRQTGDVHQWLIDTDNDGVPDMTIDELSGVKGIPVAGNFDANPDNGDEIAIFTGSTWHLDTDHDFQVDRELESDLVGYPMSGDFDGDGFDDLATWTDDTFQVDLAGGTDGGWDGSLDAEFHFGFIGVRERPIAADMDQDGIDDFGLWVPDREGSADRPDGQWFFLMSDGEPLINRIDAGEHPESSFIAFSPTPLGQDWAVEYGTPFAMPIVGNFDPPLTVGPESNDNELDADPLDLNGDGRVSPLDAMIVLNALSSLADEPNPDDARLDVNGDGRLSPLDAIIVLDHLSELSEAQSSSNGPVHTSFAARTVNERDSLIGASNRHLDSVAGSSGVETECVIVQDSSSHTPLFSLHDPLEKNRLARESVDTVMAEFEAIPLAWQNV